MKTDEFWAVKRLAVDGALALNTDAAPGTLVFDGAFYAGIDREFLGSEELLLLDTAVDNPAIDVALLTGVCHRNRLEVVIVLETGIEIALPIELVDDEV